MKLSIRKKIVYTILLFLSFSFMGWVWELFYDLAKHGMLANHGVLIGPWLPIYGSGGVLIYLILYRYKKFPTIVFMGSFVFCTIIEYVSAWYLETYNHSKWWDYSDFPFNIDGRVCLLASVFFGVIGLIGVYALIPRLKDFYDLFNFKKLTILAFVLISIFIIDYIHSIKYPHYVVKYKIIDTKKIGEIKLFKQ